MVSFEIIAVISLLGSMLIFLDYRQFKAITDPPFLRNQNFPPRDKVHLSPTDLDAIIQEAVRQSPEEDGSRDKDRKVKSD